jgi:hypothetical protein
MTCSNADRVPIGMDELPSWVELRFTQIENPHILVVGGSQSGKTSLQILIAAVAASRGNIVIICDPKLRFSRAFRHPVTREPLPNVLVYRDADPDIASREWQGILELVLAEQQRRYRTDEESATNILGDQARFPTILVVLDELGTLLDFADKEWPHRRPDDYKGKTPVREMIHTLTRMGAEARVIGCFANQTAREDEMPAGTKTRELCGQRIFLGTIRSNRSWGMLVGEGIAPPDIPDGHKGAGAVVFGDGKPVRFQAGFVDWKEHPEQIYNLAARGVPILRENGHVDEHGRLLLAGVPVPSPGRMASHVTGERLDLLQQPLASSMPGDSDETESPAPVPDQRTDSAPTPEKASGEVREPARVIVGLQDAADFCGMTVANFRRVRDSHPIEGEISKYQGNKPGWQEPDLKVWAMRHAERRTRRDESRKVGA